MLQWQLDMYPKRYFLVTPCSFTGRRKGVQLEGHRVYVLQREGIAREDIRVSERERAGDQVELVRMSVVAFIHS
jgi:hypothetical protein